jgi:hypothetical protein
MLRKIKEDRIIFIPAAPVLFGYKAEKGKSLRDTPLDQKRKPYSPKQSCTFFSMQCIHLK